LNYSGAKIAPRQKPCILAGPPKYKVLGGYQLSYVGICLLLYITSSAARINF